MVDSSKKLFRWGPIDAALLSLSYPMIASFDKMQELFGICWPESLIIYDKDKALWILENEKVSETGREFMKKIILPDTERKRFYKLWNERVKNLSEIQRKINQLNKNNMTDLIKDWNKAYLDFWAVGMTAELANYPLEERLKNQLKPYFKDERDLNEAFAVLATPTEMSFYKEEEAEVMKIALLENKEKALQKHQDKYFWIYNNYLEAKILDVNYFKEQIKHTTTKDAEEFLREIENYNKEVEDSKNKYIKELRLSDEIIKTINLLNDFILFQDVRKKYNLVATHCLEEFLKEISDRTHIPVRDLKWLLPEELEKFSDGNLEKIIEKRKHLTIFSITLRNTEEYTQNKASKIEKEFNRAEFEKSVNLQGTVACTGKNRYFRGIAKVISSPKEGDKLKQGEILVTTMTTPDFVAVIKRAGAIITDMGGVTCHAAVVSREFGTPCIVGTENATKIIKDGDILELHNLRGTVKIVSK
jgi:phosphoenolpyruvate synthase/pyruvate phosphate dikinase